MKFLKGFLILVITCGCSHDPPEHELMFRGYKVVASPALLVGDFGSDEDHGLLTSDSGKDFGIRVMETGLSLGKDEGGSSRSGYSRDDPIHAQSTRGQLEIVALLEGARIVSFERFSKLDTYTGDTAPNFHVEAQFVDLASGTKIGEVFYTGNLVPAESE